MVLHEVPLEQYLKPHIADFEQTFRFVNPTREQDFRIRNRQEQRGTVDGRDIQPVRLVCAYGRFFILAAAAFYIGGIPPVAAGHIQELMYNANRRLAWVTQVRHTLS